MLRVQSNALRFGRHVLVHDDLDPDLQLNEGVVQLVDTRAGGAHDVGIRLDTTGKVLRPGRYAVHLLPLDRRFSCWRCDTIADQGAPAERHAGAA